MKRLAVVCAALVVFMSSQAVDAGWGSLHYGGYQPWWNVFAKRNRCMSVEEERLQRFWHDYYDALKRYYGALDSIDWVSYYKNHGYQINASCNPGGGGPCGGSQRIQFAPVFVSPQMQWAVPNSHLGGPAAGPPGVPMGMPGHGAMQPGAMQPGAMYPGMMSPGCAPGYPPYAGFPYAN